MSVLQDQIPQDRYANAFTGMSAEMAGTERTEQEIKRAMTMLRPQGGKRILDLACGTGRHTLELVRHGFSVVGVEIGEELVEITRRDAAEQGLEAESSIAGIRRTATWKGR
jgi:2-polyprenyl-3-methyl-5-hydroxy-6-metoxy-1,4-benzoquinol methylase